MRGSTATMGVLAIAGGVFLTSVGHSTFGRSWPAIDAVARTGNAAIVGQIVSTDVTKDSYGIEDTADEANASAGSIGPDIILGDLYSVIGWGRVDHITAYTAGINVCNVGNERVSWIAQTNAHPVCVEGMYRLKNGRLEQIGMGWVWHEFYACSQNLCSPCTDPTNGTELGVGCSTPDSAYLLGVQGNLSLRSDVNAHTGYFPYPWDAPEPEEIIGKRIQVHDADLDPDLNEDASYFVEGHFIAADDAAAGNSNNNASYRPVMIGEFSENDYRVSPTAETYREQPAIRAWKDVDLSVVETDVQVPGEGLFIVAAKASELGDGFWHYEYAAYNLNSDRSGGSFTVPIPLGASVYSIGFHDIDYHSGEIYDPTDWDVTVGDWSITWATQDYDENPNANALRFSTLYNFWFDIDIPPASTEAIIGLFKPGYPTEVAATTIGPSVPAVDCNENGIEDICDIACGPGCTEPCGHSDDCNENLVPDECDPDLNGNGIPDDCERIGPDLIEGDLYHVGRFGRMGDIVAYAVATHACNIGDERVSWVAHTNQHPVWVQNMYRLKDGRFEQIGMSWIRHGFYAVSQSLCSPCSDPTNGTELGVGCSNPNSSYLNAVQGAMSRRSDVHAYSGYFPYPWSAPPPEAIIGKRLQVHTDDLDPDLNNGASYFVEAHDIAADDAAAGNGDNNASSRPVVVTRGSECDGGGRNGLPCGDDDDCWVCIGGDDAGDRCVWDSECRDGSCSTEAVCDLDAPHAFNLEVVGETQRELPAIRAWKEIDPSVVETDVRVPGEGLFIIAAKASHLGSGLWHYEYAVHNLNSDRSAGSFTVPLPLGGFVQNIGFHDVDYHSGEIYDLTDWDVTLDYESITWATQDYDENPNANALRFSTLYNFRFETPAPPVASEVIIGLFKPGSPSEVAATTIGPSVALIDCNENGIWDYCDVTCAGECEPPCGHSDDCNDNMVPDECEPDCNENDVADECDIADCLPDELWCADCNGNNIPDECDPDCDGDGIPDDCDTWDDADGDGIPDCFDLCPYTTPPNGCICPPMGWCCWPDISLCLPNYPHDACLLQGGTPDCVESPCRDGCLIGDYDADGDRDLWDCGALQRCFSGPTNEPGFVPPTGECLLRFDFEEDGDVDLDDYQAFYDSVDQM